MTYLLHLVELSIKFLNFLLHHELLNVRVVNDSVVFELIHAVGVSNMFGVHLLELLLFAYGRVSNRHSVCFGRRSVA